MGKEVTTEMELATLQKMVKQRQESAEVFKSNNRMDLFEVEVSELSVIQEFLPKQVSKEEVENVVKETIQKLGATSIKDMGKVMGSVTKELAGKADGKVIADAVKSMLV